MLIMFKVKNFTSFKDAAVLDMRATTYIQHPSHVIHANEKVNLLKAAALYGANASGKSNFISSMFFFASYIFTQFINKKEFPDFEACELVARRGMKLEPFMLSTSGNEVTEFEIIFLRNNKQIQYGFECTANSVISEWYYIDEELVFERNSTSITYGNTYRKQISQFKKVPSERLYLSVLEYFLDDESRKVILDNFISFFNNEYNVFTEFLFESTVKGLAGSIGLSNRLIKDLAFRRKVENYLCQIDVGIKRLDIKTETVQDSETGKKKREKVVRTVHNVFDENGIVVGEEFFDLRQESTGTLRFLAYIQNVIEMITQGGVFIVDEISARLHPLLTKMIVDIFCSEHNTKAQIIFTTHDISLLNSSQFRRDEIVFVDKNERGESTLYALSDLKVREDATFSKEYLQGKYGAIPIIKYQDCINGEVDG